MKDIPNCYRSREITDEPFVDGNSASSGHHLVPKAIIDHVLYGLIPHINEVFGPSRL